jgi:hypothetical protein
MTLLEYAVFYDGILVLSHQYKKVIKPKQTQTLTDRTHFLWMINQMAENLFHSTLDRIRIDDIWIHMARDFDANKKLVMIILITDLSSNMEEITELMRQIIQLFQLDLIKITHPIKDLSQFQYYAHKIDEWIKFAT